MKLILITIAQIALCGLIASCGKKQEVALIHSESIFSEESLAKFTKGTPLDAFLEHFGLQETPFNSHPNQEHGHEQGWYLLPEGDLMVSATLSKDGIMLLDQTPWILTKAEQGSAHQSTTR